MIPQSHSPQIVNPPKMNKSKTFHKGFVCGVFNNIVVKGFIEVTMVDMGMNIAESLIE